MSAPRPRVLLVDDDASIRRFVEMTLEVLDVDLVSCASVAEAVDALRRGGPAALVITDLMMPGESGFGLLQRLTDDPSLRGKARLAVFSAGLVEKAPEALASFDIWRRIPKPVSIRVLEDCVREALAQAVEPAGRTSDAPASAPLTAAEQQAVDAHFCGEVALFVAYREGCRQQFAHDIDEGDAALAQGDAPRLRHLAHSLKSVLLTLGHETASGTARALENEATLSGGVQGELWQQLRAHLLEIRRAAK